MGDLNGRKCAILRELDVAETLGVVIAARGQGWIYDPRVVLL